MLVEKGQEMSLLYSVLKNSRIAGVRDRWRCLGVLFQKIQIPSTKFQIKLKFKYPMTKTFQNETLFGY